VSDQQSVRCNRNRSVGLWSEQLPRVKASRVLRLGAQQLAPLGGDDPRDNRVAGQPSSSLGADRTDATQFRGWGAEIAAQGGGCADHEHVRSLAPDVGQLGVVEADTCEVDQSVGATLRSGAFVVSSGAGPSTRR
jgi:hypothetical protein